MHIEQDKKSSIIESKSECRFFLGNITSLSLAARDTLFSQNADIICCVESHKTTSFVENICDAQHYHVSCTNPEKTQSDSYLSKGHGGEFVACRKQIYSDKIPKEVFDAIERHTNAPLRFAARTVRFKHLTIIVASIYLWCGEGLSERNTNLIQQLEILTNTLGLPLICYGDFNIDSKTLAESGFLDKLNVQVLAPDSSTIASSDSIIDYVLISRSISGIVKSLKIDSAVAFAPHFGRDLVCHTRPLEVKGKVLCIPKALPLESFNSKWAELDSEQQDRAHRGANIMAYNRLQHHKLKTGIQ